MSRKLLLLLLQDFYFKNIMYIPLSFKISSVRATQICQIFFSRFPIPLLKKMLIREFIKSLYLRTCADYGNFISGVYYCVILIAFSTFFYDHSYYSYLFLLNTSIYDDIIAYIKGVQKNADFF